MIWARLYLTALSMLLALPALAGPWPREPGRFFASSSVTSELHYSQWLEIGVRRGQWFSLQGDRSMNAPPTLALSYHRAFRDFGAWKTSASLGAVLRGPDFNTFGWLMTRPLGPLQWRRVEVGPELGLQIGASVGRSMEWPKPGWLAFKARYRHGPLLRQIKAEATWGIRPTDRLSLIGQMHLSKGNSQDLLIDLGASGVLHINQTISIELGLNQPLLGGHKPTVKLGGWLEF